MNDAQQTLSSPLMRELPVSRRQDALRSSETAGAEARLELNLNQHWQFWRDEQSASARGAGDGALPDGSVAWEEVNLPHSVRLEPVNASGGRNFQGICWYRRILKLSPDWRDRILYLHFEGAMQVAEVWMNGRKVAMHFGGYTPFTLDLTREVDFDSTNTLLVRLDNRDQPQVPPGKRQAKLDFTYFGGLYRNVRLLVMDRLHLSDPILTGKTAGGGVFVRYEHVHDESAEVLISAEVCNEHPELRSCTLSHELIDADGELAAKVQSNAIIGAGEESLFESRLRIESPRLWHPQNPYLYRLRTRVVDSTGGRIVDEQSIRIGIRHIRFDKEDGFFINGRKFLSIGANRHQDHPYVGYALPDSAHWRDARKLRDAGFTSVRCHYPQSPAFMDACDEMGILAIVSNPGWQLLGDEPFRRRAIENARIMIRRDRNRPSVILWEAALNESDNRPIGAALQQAVHEEYPGDQCYTAGDHEPGFEFAGRTGWDVEFYRNDGSKPFWIREWGDHVDNWRDQQSPNRVARGWGEAPMLVQAKAHLRRMDEIMVSHHGTSSGTNARRLCGACLWAGIDHARGYHHQNFFGGVLDAFRLPKFSYYFFQSQRPVGEGAMVFIANFASFLSPAEVLVFSNCDDVRLSRDGQVIEQRRPDEGHLVPHPPFTFQVGRFSSEHTTMFMSASADGRPDAPVALLAEGLINGQVVARHEVRPPGVATQVMLEADLCGYALSADGADWVRLHARICDARGVLVPCADDQVSFSVEGPGELIGDGAIGANPVHAAGGIATALLRAGSSAGQIRIRASAFGLSPGLIEIVSEPCRKIEALIRNSSGSSREAGLH